MNFWKNAQQKSGIKLNTEERMEHITRLEDGFLVKTPKGEYHSKAVLLAIGRRGSPRKLGAPGEDDKKVVYKLDDLAQYRDQRVLVVGGGNSALEAAMSIAEEPSAKVTLSYRGSAFQKANPKNVVKLDEAVKAGQLQVVMNSSIKRITPKTITIKYDNKEVEIQNDGVLVCAGGILPTPMLKELGIQIETKFGTA